MLTIQQIFNKTDALRVFNSQYVKFQRVKKGRNKLGQGYIAVQAYSTKVKRPDGTIVVLPELHAYVAMITFIDQKLHCKVSCSCPDFLYREEYVLTRNGAADIEYSNGDPARITNPRNIPYCCKHLIAIHNKIKHLLPE